MWEKSVAANDSSAEKGLYIGIGLEKDPYLYVDHHETYAICMFSKTAGDAPKWLRIG